jgi:hypothetical protein
MQRSRSDVAGGQRELKKAVRSLCVTQAANGWPKTPAVTVCSPDALHLRPALHTTASTLLLSLTTIAPTLLRAWALRANTRRHPQLDDNRRLTRADGHAKAQVLPPLDQYVTVYTPSSTRVWAFKATFFKSKKSKKVG